MSFQKPRIRVKAGNIYPTADSIESFYGGLGINPLFAQTIESGVRYNFNNLSLNMYMLDALYETSWIAGMAVDLPAKDMTQGGIKISSELAPDKIETINEAFHDLRLWNSLCEVIQWGRLYGGAIAIILIDGDDLERPLLHDRIRKDSFRGLQVFDRWYAVPDTSRQIKELGENFGLPEYYQIYPAGASGTSPSVRVHYTRVLRFTGDPSPKRRAVANMMWGKSVLDRIVDRIQGFDTIDAAITALVYQSNLRVVKKKGLVQAMSTDGRALEGVKKSIDYMSRYQSLSKITLLDAEDDFQAHSYQFGGLSDIALQKLQQIAGALQIPLVRLLGQSPAGLNSTGESDLRTYYDNIKREQENCLRHHLQKLLHILCQSVLGAVDDTMSFVFNPLWQMSEQDKADIGQKKTATVLSAYDAGIIPAEVALRELRQTNDVTGLWSNVTDEVIADAENTPPEMGEEEKEATLESTGQKFNELAASTDET